MANPYLSHLASRVKNDLAFLSNQGVLTTQDIQNLNAKLDQITLNQIGNQIGNLQIDAMHTGASQMSQMSSGGGGKSMCKAVWDYNKTQVSSSPTLLDAFYGSIGASSELEKSRERCGDGVEGEKGSRELIPSLVSTVTA